MSGAPQPHPPGSGLAGAGRRPRVLFAHGRSIIGLAVSRVLSAHGFSVEQVADADQVHAALAGGSFDALVVDVALPGAPGFELTGPAREAGVRVVILVASVFRRTSYKRRPLRLYGADDYVEIHHLGDQLPARLRAHLGLGVSELPAETLREVLEVLHGTGDQRLREETPESLAGLIVADLLLYNGDRVAEAESVEQALSAVAGDLEHARALFAQVRPELVREGEPRTDLIDAAFRKLVASLDSRSREGETR
ncbi:response regulator [Nannocystaceae bacterium ST9]